jgi:hypothetical protein
MMFSAAPEESPTENMRMLFDATRRIGKTAERCGKRGCFSAEEPATFSDPDCYTLQTFASNSREIRSAYYYYYKRTRAGVKEETTWS